jgi:hypothetical protein
MRAPSRHATPEDTLYCVVKRQWSPASVDRTRGPLRKPHGAGGKAGVELCFGGFAALFQHHVVGRRTESPKRFQVAALRLLDRPITYPKQRLWGLRYSPCPPPPLKTPLCHNGVGGWGMLCKSTCGVSYRFPCFVTTTTPKLPISQVPYLTLNNLLPPAISTSSRPRFGL